MSAPKYLLRQNRIPNDLGRHQGQKNGMAARGGTQEEIWRSVSPPSKPTHTLGGGGEASCSAPLFWNTFLEIAAGASAECTAFGGSLYREAKASLNKIRLVVKASLREA